MTLVKDRSSVLAADVSPAGEAMDEGTKALLLAPAVDHIIERPRLISILEGSDARTIGFLAPAGYGKTTLARQWCERQSTPIAWYRTSRMSGDVAALSVGLDNLFATVVDVPDRDPRRIGSIASVNPTPPPLARAFVSIYRRRAPRELLLVLDEWEAAATEEADAFMGAVLEELDVRVLVTSRESPPWFTARQQIYGEALEIGMEQLAMTDAEAIKVIAAEPEAEATKALLETARGWPAVLGLAAIQTNRRLPERVRPEALYEFLATDLLGAAPASVREGLQLLAISGTRDLTTAAALLGDAAEPLLDQAEKLALVHRESKATFSVHPLLRELLIASTAELPPETRTELAEKLRPLIAAERWEEALAAVEVVADGDFTIEALRQALPELLESGRVETLRRWVEIGRTTTPTAGLVAYAEGEVALREGDYERAIALGELAATSLEADEAGRAHLLAGWGANLSDRAELARKHFERATALATTERTRRDASWRTLVQALDDEACEARELLEDFAKESEGDIQGTVRTAQARVRLAVLEGGLARSVTDAQIAHAVAGRAGPIAASSFYNVLSGGLASLGRYEAALDAAQRMRELAEQSGAEFIALHALLAYAHALISLRRIGPAQRALSELERSLRSRHDISVAANLAIERARLFITVGDLRRALATLDVQCEPRLEAAALGEYLALRALVHSALHDFERMTLDIKSAKAASRSEYMETMLMAAHCIAAVASGDPSGVDALLDRESKDVVVMACRASEAVARSAAALPARRTELLDLLRASQDTALARRVGLRVMRPTRRSAQLSPRELEIHELIAQGLTNPEIAKLLFISESTTKVHVKHILEKLGVRSRVEAARVWEETREQQGSR